MDDAYNKHILAKVEKDARAAFIVSALQLGVGTVLAIVCFYYIAQIGGDPHVILPVIGLIFALYLLAGGHIVPIWIRRTNHYLSFHPNNRLHQATVAVRNGMYDDVNRFNGQSDALTETRRRTKVVFLCRMLVITAILAVIVIIFALNDDGQSGGMRHNHVTGEVWLTDRAGDWYGIGP